jgi:hypothetical protein
VTNLPTDLKGFLAFLADVDVKTVLAIVTALVSVWLFSRRYREEARKTRITRLETISLDQLFRFREQLVSCLDRFEDLPDISDDATAQAFWAGLRSIRRDVRKSIDEYALFSAADAYQKHSSAFTEADQHYHAFYNDLIQHRVNYTVVNRFKRFLYGLLEDVGARILEIQALDGRSRTAEITALRSRYRSLRNEIDELVNKPTNWVPVENPPGARGAPTVTSPSAPSSADA